MEQLERRLEAPRCLIPLSETLTDQFELTFEPNTPRPTTVGTGSFRGSQQVRERMNDLFGLDDAAWRAAVSGSGNGAGPLWPCR